jgi:hypothetical protein
MVDEFKGVADRMWRRWLAVLGVAALAITLVAVAEIFSLATEGQPLGRIHTQNQYQPVYASFVQLVLGGWNWLRDRVDHDTITTTFIAATAFFTGTLWWSTRRLWESSEAQGRHLEKSIAEASRSAAAMEQVATSLALTAASTVENMKTIREMTERQRDFTQRQMRAYVFVQNGEIFNVAEPLIPIPEGERPPPGAITLPDRGPVVLLAIRNFGHTPASNAIHSMNAVFREWPLVDPLPELGNNALDRSVFVIPPSGEIKKDFVFPNRLTDEQIAGLRNATAAIYVYGRITYLDISISSILNG